MGRVIIGMDPHKRSATIEIIDDREKVLAQGRFGTDRAGYQAMLALGRQLHGPGLGGGGLRRASAGTSPNAWSPTAKPSSMCRRSSPPGLGCSPPAKAARPTRSTRTRVAVAALRTNGLRQVAVDDTTVALRLLVDRRDGLGRARTDTVNRIHQLLLELLPGGAKKFLSAPQARALLNTVRPRDIVGRTRRQLASELITELAIIDKKIKAANAQLTELVDATGSNLQQLNGIGPSGAARPCSPRRGQAPRHRCHRAGDRSTHIRPS